MKNKTETTIAIEYENGKYIDAPKKEILDIVVKNMLKDKKDIGFIFKYLWKNNPELFIQTNPLEASTWLFKKYKQQTN